MRRVFGSKLGFTLLEVLIALAVLSIGVLAGMRAIGMSVESAQEAHRRQLAQWAAQNRLAEMRAYALFPPVSVNEQVVTLGKQRFRVREEVRATPNPLFRRVDVRVSVEGEDHVLSQLSGLVVRSPR